MTLNNLKNKAAEAVDGIAGKAKEIGSDAVKAAGNSLQNTSQTVQQIKQDIRKAHYNPLFPEEFKDPQFDLPSMIVIVDEDERSGIDVCEGAIGWLSKEGGLNVLHLYQECVPFSGLDFFPSANCYAVYYYDTFNKNRFIDLSKYYDVVQKEKITELRNVAYALGVKECQLESYEADKSIQLKNAKGDIKARKEDIDADVSVQATYSAEKSSGREQTILLEQCFEGASNPSRPNLQWYKNDSELNSLIAMRCDDKINNPIKEYSITIDNSSSATMSQNMALKIDGALKKLGAVCNFSMKEEAQKESRSKLIFKIKF